MMAEDKPKEATELSQSRPTIIITGASSGLGRAFFEHFANSLTSPWRVVGIDKQLWKDDAGTEHSTYYHQGKPALNIELDVTRSANELRKALLLEINENDPIPLVIHCAGIRGLVPKVPILNSDGVASAETLEVMDPATLMRTYEINVVGTFNILSALLPNLRLAAKAELNPRVVVMSSRMGSIAANKAGGGYAYRASKAALNAVLKSMSIDVPDVFFAMVHPGRVETGLVSVKEDGAISVEESLGDVMPLIERFGVDEKFSSACFLDRYGEVLAW
ncbi:hypothetical protein N0V82_007723 [Gnomoniopsis sp. IMI 355080]|nr:hypothetical protein N0V82_007723 [Gnomoniopsis sp. IMI 355080]